MREGVLRLRQEYALAFYFDQDNTMPTQINNKPKIELVSKDIVSFFDLLARFDYEDKQKEKSVVGTGSLDVIPKESLPETDCREG